MIAELEAMSPQRSRASLKLTLDELAAEYAEKPPTVSDALRAQNASAQAQVMGKYADVDLRKPFDDEEIPF